MSSSPDSLFKELASEQVLIDSARPPKEVELAADWHCRQELRALDTPALPPRLRAQLLARTSQRRNPAWWMGLAAAITLALAVGLVQQTTEQAAEPIAQAVAVSDSDLHQLQLALATLDESVRRTRSIAERELATSLSWPDLGVEHLPYGQTLQQWFQPRPGAET